MISSDAIRRGEEPVSKPLASTDVEHDERPQEEHVDDDCQTERRRLGEQRPPLAPSRPRGDAQRGADEDHRQDERDKAGRDMDGEERQETCARCDQDDHSGDDRQGLCELHGGGGAEAKRGGQGERECPGSVGQEKAQAGDQRPKRHRVRVTGGKREEDCQQHADRRDQKPNSEHVGDQVAALLGESGEAMYSRWPTIVRPASLSAATTATSDITVT